jgi:hypothetical protein
MKRVAVVVLTGILAAATGYAQGQGSSATPSQGQPTPGSQPDQTDPSAVGTAGKDAPAPIAVEVVAVDPKAKTITVRDIAAVPAPPGKAVEVTLPVPANATGDKLSDVKAGEKVDVTCAVKPTVHPTAGVPIVLTDCIRVIKIQSKS